MRKTMHHAHFLTALMPLLLIGCGKPPVEIPEAVRPVYIYAVTDPTLERVRAFAGNARPALETEISFRVGGEILELTVKPGEPVKTGELLARLDTSDYELQLRQAEAQRDQAEALLKQASAQYARTRELYESQNISKSELDQARAASESYEAQLEAAQKAVELASLQLEYCTLRAPFDGRVVSKTAEQRQTVAAGQSIATLTSGNVMEMVVGIPETLINRVRLGNQADVVFDSIPGGNFTAEVTEVGVENTGQSTYSVRLTIREQDDRIRPGMAGEASLAFATEGEQTLTIPAECVVSEAKDQYFVWVVNPETSRVQKRAVQPGALTSLGLNILSGLQPGDQVVTRGVHKLAENTPVRILTGNDATP
ncbi:MAG: efflux RND transporter periplasmic adaptor subunit [Kiritimatiellae bacterium]|nr:efflux RND transporter periplasmic adaptor subunit [Kiritimatiellia bacterium]